MGSAVHLGLIDMDRVFNVETRINVASSIVLSTVMAAFAGVAGYLAIVMSGGSTSLWRLVSVSLLSGTLAGVLLALMTVGIILFAVKRGLDPDNITGPVLATMGDLVTMVCLFGSAILIGGI